MDRLLKNYIKVEINTSDIKLKGTEQDKGTVTILNTSHNHKVSAKRPSHALAAKTIIEPIEKCTTCHHSRAKWLILGDSTLIDSEDVHIGVKLEVPGLVTDCKVALGHLGLSCVKGHLVTSQPALVPSHSCSMDSRAGEI